MIGIVEMLNSLFSMFDLSISIIGSNKEPINIYLKELEILPVYLQTCE